MFKNPLILYCVFSLGFLFAKPLRSQEIREITLEDILLEGTFRERTVSGINWMKDGQYYTSQSYASNGAGIITKYNITTGQAVETLFSGNETLLNGRPFSFDGYEMSPNERQILLITDLEYIYRRSTMANFYLFNIAEKNLVKLNDDQKVSYVTFSPDGSHVAYVRNNNLFFKNLGNMREIRVTADGKRNEIINGSGDWVYEEEFYISQAFYWSPDSRKIAFFRFDERQVEEYNMQLWGPLYPEDYRFKYPKAGEKNALVQIKVYNLDRKKTITVQSNTTEEDYIPRIYWTSDPNMLSVVKMNRLQNEMDIMHVNTSTGRATTVVKETSNTYVDINYNSQIIYLSNNSGFLRTSEKDGYKHVYLHDMDGRQIRQITQGQWEVDELYGLDERNGIIYYTSTEVSPLERHVYRIDLEGRNKQKLSPNNGTNHANFSNDFTYFILYHSSSKQPVTVTLQTAPDGKLVKELEKNDRVKKLAEEYGIRPREFFQFQNEAGVTLNGYFIKPHDFDPSKQYPTLMFVYGGPGHQLVLDNWNNMRDYWHYHLAQKGYIIACIDNRGTGGRGKEFKDLTYGNLGKLETEDQISGARYLASLPFIDAASIGIWGWSYGGYMSSLAVLLGADYFSMAIAVAPVTSWRFYDTIYTERYLKTPQLNPDGYDDYSPITHALKLRAPYLLIHGTGDDNVHFQNTVEMIEALVAGNIQFDVFIYPNRAHGISDIFGRYHLFTLMTNFVEKNLKVREENVLQGVMGTE
jgi:dipeptidyl-peptidase 4